jgi:cytoskeleton protein RodZ
MAVGKRRAEDETPGVRNNVIEAPITPRRITVSDSLRGRRIECGLDIDYIAEILRIRPAVLIAIENGDFDQLPGPAYAVGFVRSYATYLGLDSDALVVRFKTETAEIARRPHLQFPLPIRDSRVPTGPLLVICVLLAIAIYGGWYYYFARPGQISEMVPNVPERLQHLLALPPPQKEAAKPTTDTAQQLSMQPTAPAPATQQASNPAPQTVTQAAETHAVSVAPTAPSAPAQTQPAQSAAPQTVVDGVPPVENQPGAPPIVSALPASPDLAQPAVSADSLKPAGDSSYGAPDGQARIVLRATADSWIQVRDKSSNLLFTRVLKQGEHYNVPNQDGLTMIAGNAGALDVTVDGMAAPHLGELGKVARNVSLDPGHLLATASHAN